MSKNKTHRIYLEGQAPPHVVARARAKAVNHANLTPDIGNGPNENTGIAGGLGIKEPETVNANLIQTNPKKVSKKEFYTFRDSVYKLIADSGKDIGGIQGNPFSKFSHAEIKDSPLKNYAPILSNFKEMVKQYFPEIYASIQNMSYQAQKENTNASELELDVEETLKGVSSEYIQSLYEKEKAGLTLSKVEKNILRAYERLQDELRDGAKRQVKSDLEKFIGDNWLIIILILFVLFSSKKR